MKKTDVLLIYNNEFQFDKEQVTKLRTEFPQYSIIDADESELTDAMIESSEIIVGFVKEKLIKKAKNLKWLHVCSAGVEMYLNKDMYCNQGVLLTNSSGVYGKSISEHVMGFIIMLSRNMHFFRDNQTLAKWEKIKPKKDLFTSTIGIIGLGDIGNAIAKKAKAFGMRVLAVKKKRTRKPDYVDELYTTEEVERVIKRADFVVLSLAVTPETVNIMSGERLHMMKNDAYLINIGRGTLVDQDALYDVLKENKIAGAAIDVATPEPLSENSPLWGLKNLIVTPHLSGQSPSASERHFSIFYNELKRYSRGEELNNLVDFNLKY